MSSSPPPPEADGPSWGPGGEPPYQQPAPKSRGITAVVIATVLAVVVAGGALAFYKLDPLHLFRAGPQAAEALPADALFYVGLDLDPSAEQKVAAVRFLNHFPAFRDSVGLDDETADVRKRIFEQAAASAGCTGVSYDDDIAPWIGGKFGFAGVPGGQGSADPDVMVAVEVTDADAASVGLHKLQSCGQPSGDAASSFGFAFTGDYVVLAQTQDLAEQFTASTEDASLADDDNFSSDMESLGDLGVATMWVNVSGAMEAFGPATPAGGATDLLKTAYQRAAATLRFSSDSVQFVTSIFGNTPAIDHGDNQIVDLPDSTVFAISEAGGAARLDASWDDIMSAAKAQGTDVDTALAQFETQTGLAVPDDLRTLLGDNVLLALDSEGLTSEAIQAADPSLLNVGVRFTNDPDALNAIYDKVLALLEGQTQQSLPFVKHDAGDGIAVATNDTYAESLVGLDGGLGDTAEFQSVTDDAAGKEFVLFFNWDSVEEQVLQAAQSSGAPQTLIDNLRPLRAFGITSGVDGDYTLSTLRLSVND